MHKKSERRQAEFVKFLHWLADGPKPWLAPNIKQWRREHETRQLRRERGGGPWSVAYWNPAIDPQAAHLHALKRAFYYVKRHGYIDVKEKGNELILTLTHRGRMKLFRDTKKNAPKFKNGTVLLVLFDIPIDANPARQALRHFLRTNGFRRLQHSVWYCTDDLSEPFAELIHDLKLEKWIHIAIANFRTTLPKQL